MRFGLIFFEIRGSTALILILTFGAGLLVGFLSTLPKQLRTRSKLKELQKKEGSGLPSGSSSSSPKWSSGFPRAGGTVE